MEDPKTCTTCNWMMSNHPGCRKVAKIILLVILLLILIGAFTHGHGDNKNAQQNTIVVSGKGTITIKPDMATLSFSVTQENLDVAKASDGVNTKIAAIVATLKADGVDEKDIKTTDYSINPQYNYVNTPQTVNGVFMPSGTQVLAGYDVTDGISINIKDLTKAGKIVSDLGSAGVTDMSGLTFTSSNQDDLMKQARDQAIADARSQAEGLAKSLGVNLDKIVGYSEDANRPIYYATMAAAPMAMGKSVDATLPTGQNTITSNVSITYEIR